MKLLAKELLGGRRIMGNRNPKMVPLQRPQSHVKRWKIVGQSDGMETAFAKNDQKK